MTVDLPSYPSYKPAGLSWLDQVPAHWEIKRNGQLFSQRKETGFAELPILEVSLRTGVRVRQFDGSARKQVMSDKSKYKRAAKGDVAYNMMRMWQGAVGVAPEDGLVSPAYVVASPFAGVQPKYFSELFRTAAYMGEVDTHSHGIVKDRNRLYWEDFKQIFSIFPPPGEQQAIERFVNRFDRMAHRYIRVKQKLIGLLAEQKQALIDRAVTRGLDVGVQLRPSGVEWLGEIPGHWENRRMRSLISRVTSGSRGWSDFAADAGVLFIRIGNLTRTSLSLDLENTVRLQLPSATLGEAARTRIKPDDILLSITAFIGSVAVVPADIEEAYVSQHVACCRLRPGASDPQWVGYVLLSSVGQRHGQLSMYGGTKQGLSLDDVKNYVVPLPPLEEQIRIVRWIEAASHSLDAAILAAKREIVLAREYRTRLITDVVTGQLDVREAVSSLPDESGEPDELSLMDDILGEGDEAHLGMDDMAEEVAE